MCCKIQKWCWWRRFLSLVCSPHLWCCRLVGCCFWIHLVGLTCAIDVLVCLARLWWWFLHCMMCQILYHRGILHNLHPLLLMHKGGCSLLRMLDELHSWVQVVFWVGFGDFLVFLSWLFLVAWWYCSSWISSVFAGARSSIKVTLAAESIIEVVSILLGLVQQVFDIKLSTK